MTNQSAFTTADAASVFWKMGKSMVEEPLDCMLVWIALVARVAARSPDTRYSNDLEEKANKGEIL